MTKRNHLNFRTDDGFAGYVKGLALALSEKEGRNVRITDVMWKIIDYGRPLLEEELESYLCDKNMILSKQKLDVAAAQRSIKLGLLALDRAFAALAITEIEPELVTT